MARSFGFFGIFFFYFFGNEKRATHFLSNSLLQHKIIDAFYNPKKTPITNSLNTANTYSSCKKT